MTNAWKILILTIGLQTNIILIIYAQNPKMQKAVANLVKELNEESVLRGGKERDKKMERIEAGLDRARASIKDAIIKSRQSPPLTQDPDYVPQGQIYVNGYVFQR